MNDKTLKAVLGGLLHDIGKLLLKAGKGDNHRTAGYEFLNSFIGDKDILNCVGFHHEPDLEPDLSEYGIDDSAVAYAVYLADSIAEGADSIAEGTNAKSEDNSEGKGTPLASVFNLLKRNDPGKFSYECNPGKYSYKCKLLDEKISLPEEGVQLSEEDCSKLVDEFEKGLEGFKGFKPCDSWVERLYSLEERCMSFIPSDSMSKEHDISLFDHLKMTAALAACICEYLEEKGKNNFREALVNDKAAFLDEKAFLMFSCDFSGIQSFIYSIVSESALKSLRSRSFWLEMVMEHCVDELLEQAGVPRTNLIYSGGGHCYVILPNTKKAREAVDKLDSAVNEWLMDNFGDSLYMGCAWRECSANDLLNIPEKDEPYKRIYRDLSRMLSEKKAKRYSADQLRKMNSTPVFGRECKVCGTSSKDVSLDGWCPRCKSFVKMSDKIVRNFKGNDNIFVILNEKPQAVEMFLDMPSCSGQPRYLSFTDNGGAEAYRQSRILVRAYCKNNPTSSNAINIYMGDYIFEPDFKKLFNKNDEEGKGLKRLGVYRADVDNLGTAFISGFDKNTTLSRTASFSRELSRFFKYYINGLLASKCEEELRKDFEVEDGNRVNIVYSGGDDLFIVGKWNDVIYSAAMIEKMFEKFSLEKLTLSGGISIYSPTYPIRSAAIETAELEEQSKNNKDDNKEKDSITLFTAGNSDRHTYHWKTFFEKVINEKFKTIRDFFDKSDERGMAFLYRILQLLRHSDKKINIARLAYLLAKLEPEKKEEYSNAYKTLHENVNKWARNNVDRMQLITAIYIYIYLERQGNQKK